NYLLFRPIGIILLAKLYVHFYKKSGGLDFLSANINKIGFVFPDSPLKGILWNKGKMEAKSVNQTLAFDLCLYILNHYPENEKEELKERYRIILKNPMKDLPTTIQTG
ncbi:MAG: hypothetical protein EBZ77_14385, partial [Chitinophagia bacterium]|nr:hypothetical protein [Chitinophagia bacterium]